MRKLAILGCLLLPSCTAATSGYRPLPPLALATLPYEWTGAASMTGTLFYEHDCLLFHDEGENRVVLPVWPDGSRFDGNTVIMHTPGKADQPVLVSEEAVLTGNLLQGPPPPSLARFEHQCPSRPFVVTAVTPAN